jgi:hypothetical protein
MLRCQAIKKDGKQCVYKPRPEYGNLYCGVHKREYLSRHTAKPVFSQEQHKDPAIDRFLHLRDEYRNQVSNRLLQSHNQHGHSAIDRFLHLRNERRNSITNRSLCSDDLREKEIVDKTLSSSDGRKSLIDDKILCVYYKCGSSVDKYSTQYCSKHRCPSCGRIKDDDEERCYACRAETDDFV